MIGIQIFKTVCQTVFITLQSIGENEYGKTKITRMAVYLRLKIVKRTLFLSPQIVLAFGNYMNSSKRGPAIGFKLESLQRVSITEMSPKSIPRSA